MAHTHQAIETGIDRLHTLVTSRGDISLTQAAKALNVSRKMVSNWADALEDADMISVQHALGDTHLVSPNNQECKKIATTIKRHWFSLRTPKLTEDELSLKKKEEMIAKQLNELEKQRLEFKQMSADKDELLKLQHDLKSREKKIRMAERELIKREAKVADLLARNESILASIEAGKTAIACDKATLAKREKALEEQVKSVAKKEKVLRHSVQKIQNIAIEV